MSDKSPRQALSKKKSGDTIKQKRAAKRAKGEPLTSIADVPKAKHR
jgi:hypothetical protein